MTDDKDYREAERLRGAALHWFARVHELTTANADISQLENPVWRNTLPVAVSVHARDGQLKRELEHAWSDFRDYLKCADGHLGDGESLLDPFIDGLVKVAYAVGVLQGRYSSFDPEEVIKSAVVAGLAARSKAAQAQATERAAEARRKLGDPTREAARQLMRLQPHLSFTACARKIAGDRDEKGVREVIAELFPKGPDGRRRYIGDDPTEPPGLSGR